MSTVIITWLLLLLLVSAYVTIKLVFKRQNRPTVLNALPELKARLQQIKEIGGVFGLSIIFVLLGPFIIPLLLAGVLFGDKDV